MYICIYIVINEISRNTYISAHFLQKTYISLPDSSGQIKYNYQSGKLFSAFLFVYYLLWKMPNFVIWASKNVLDSWVMNVFNMKKLQLFLPRERRVNFHCYIIWLFVYIIQHHTTFQTNLSHLRGRNMGSTYSIAWGQWEPGAMQNCHSVSLIFAMLFASIWLVGKSWKMVCLLYRCCFLLETKW